MSDPRPRSEDEEILARQELPSEERAEELLAAARAARAAKDLARAHAYYMEAANLGSADADYAIGVFHVVGQVVARDPKQAQIYLRRAADAGHLQARVHLANLLESGALTGSPDAERATLFVRGAARSLGLAGIDSEDDKLALSEAGIGRFLDEVTLDEDDRARLSRKARALGWGRRSALSEPELPPLEISAPAPVAAPAPAPGEAPKPAAAKAKVVKRKNADRPSFGEAIAAAGFSALFLGAGWGVAFAASEAAHEALAMGQQLPLIGRNLFLLWPIGVLAIGALPINLFYRAGAYWRGIGVGVAAGFAGFTVHGTGALVLLESRALQGLAAGTVGFWLTLLVLGFLGGAKRARGTL